jgi:NitT/TauT family transport system substrate-binding protein
MNTSYRRKSAFSLAFLFVLTATVWIPAALFSQTGNSGPESDGEKTDLVIAALRGPTGVGVAPVIAEAPMEGAHSRITVEIVPDPSVMVGRLASGEAQIGMLPSNVAAQLYNRGIPVQIAAVTLWGLLYVAGTDGDIGDWSDLRGKTLHAINRGAGPDIMLRHILSANGIDPDRDVDLNYRFGHVELAQMVIAGEIERAVLPEPFVTQVLSRRSDASVLLDFQEAWQDLHGSRYPQTVVLVRTDIAERAPEAVQEALDAIRAGWEEVLRDPAAGGVLAEEAGLGLPGAVVTAALSRFNAGYVSVEDAREELDEYFTILWEAEPRSVGGTVPDGGIYLPLR